MVNQKNKTIKILRIINRFNVGGPIHNVANLTKYLDHPYETLLIGGKATENEQDATYLLDDLHIPYQKLDTMSRKLSLFSDLLALISIIKIIKSYQPDIIHTHASKAGVLGRIAGKICGVKLIVHTYHGHVFKGYFNSLASKLIVSFERILGKLTTKIVVISERQKSEICERYKIVPLQKIALIRLGFNLEEFLNCNQYREEMRNQLELTNYFAVGIIGRLTPIKNHKLFIDAAAIVYQKNPVNFKFLIIGGGELERELKNYVETYYPELQHCITFNSWVREMPRIYSALDLVCLTSKNEGTPVSLIEAQAAGIPVISSNVGGVSDTILTNETGYLLEEFSATELANRILELYVNQEQRIKMSQNARKFVEDRYSHMNLVKQMDALYKTILK